MKRMLALITGLAVCLMLFSGCRSAKPADDRLSLTMLEKQLQTASGEEIVFFFGLGESMRCQADDELTDILRVSEWKEAAASETDPEQAQFRFRWLYFREGETSYYVTVGDRYAALERYDYKTESVDGLERIEEELYDAVYFELPQEEEREIKSRLQRKCNAYAREHNLPD